jgi:signal transduction histidine kinase
MLLGEKTVSDESSSQIYEIYCRQLFTEVDGKEFTFVINDISKTRQKEQLNAEMRYKSLFFSKISHEFKNPLICISELVQQLEVSHDEKLKKQIISHTKGLSSFLMILIKDLNFFSQNINQNIQKFEVSRVDIDELFKFCEIIGQTLISKLNISDSLKLIIENETKIKSFLSDEGKLKQILINFISNAIKFTFSGEVFLRCKLFKENSTETLQFSVKDTGVGIKDEDIAKMFKPFSKNQIICNESGSGLGLYIVKGILENLGGKLDFFTKYGEGSIFSILLPFNVNRFNFSPMKLILLKIKYFQPD